jgi:hypothetical protein
MSDRNKDAGTHATRLFSGDPLKESRHAFTPS